MSGCSSPRTLIVTVTLNAALDRTLVAPNFALGTSRSVAPAVQLAGGKGLNVARALRVLDCPVLALGFAGGDTGAQMRRSLADEGLPHALTASAQESRICTAIVDPIAGTATEVNETGAPVTPDEVEAFLAAFRHSLANARMICLSGSLPPGIAENFYGTLIAEARAVGVPCVLDSRGPALRLGVAAAPLLAKPNRLEAAELFGATVDLLDMPVVRSLMRERPLPAMAISLGPDGAVFHSAAGAWRVWAPIVRPIDTVGAGDAFVAGLIAGITRAARDRDLYAALAEPRIVEAMLRLATATAVAATLTIGAGRCDRRDIERLLPLVTVQAL